MVKAVIFANTHRPLVSFKSPRQKSLLCYISLDFMSVLILEAGKKS